jgi:glycosyltransferase involved in cell wall biosynthesis
MRIGLLARADRTGLAVQTHEFWKHIKPAKTLLIRPTWINMENFDPSMYPGATIMDSHPYPIEAMVESEIIDEFLNDLDVVFTCETPYNFWLFKRAHQRGIRTVLQFNYEFLYTLSDGNNLPRPDLLLAPSLWHYNNVDGRKAYLPVPVNRDVLPFKRRTELRTILHTVGKQAIHDRNGTELLMVAMSMLPSSVDVKLIVTSQGHIPNLCPGRVKRRMDSIENYYDLYNEGDIMILPRKFGGLCLPLNEASSCGMPVIMTDLDPQNRFLPPEAMVPAVRKGDFVSKVPIDIMEPSPVEIANKIVELYENPELVGRLSDASNAYAESISWPNMLPKYLEMFENLIG